MNFDDDTTLILDTEQKNIDAAYLLFFKRIDMPTSSVVNFTDMKQVGNWNLNIGLHPIANNGNIVNCSATTASAKK